MSSFMLPALLVSSLLETKYPVDPFGLKESVMSPLGEQYLKRI